MEVFRIEVSLSLWNSCKIFCQCEYVLTNINAKQDIGPLMYINQNVTSHFFLQFCLNFPLHVVGANKISLEASSSFLIFSMIELVWNHYVDNIVSQFENQMGQNVPGNGKKYHVHSIHDHPTNADWYCFKKYMHYICI